MRSSIPAAALAALLARAAIASPAPPGPACGPAGSFQTVTLVHATDTHARYHPGRDGISPYARLRGYFEAVRKENPHALLLGGGDDHEKGSVADSLSSGTATTRLVKALGYDARVLGNHDFAWGQEALLDYARDSRAAVLASNIRPLNPALAFAATDYAEIRLGSATLSFIGLVTMPWNERDEPYPGRYPGFRGDYGFAAAARRVIARRRPTGTLVLLSHLGREDDLKVAAAVPRLDLVLGGHTHGVTWDPIAVGRTLVIESGYNLEKISRVDLDIDLASGRPCAVRHRVVLVDEDLPADPGIQAEVERVLAESAPGWDRAVSCSSRGLDAAGTAAAAARAVRLAEDDDAALIDAMTVWTPWPQGPLSSQDLHDAFAVERQPPGAPGFSALARTRLSGGALARLAALPPGRWAYAGPARPDPRRTYSLLLTRRAAAHAAEFLGVPIPPARHAGEVWELLARAARRAGPGACLDAAAEGAQYTPGRLTP